MKYIPLLLCLFLFSTQSIAQNEVKSSDVIMDAAYKQAKKQKKNVFVLFHASWCSWCHKMDDAMQDESCKKSFDDNYVIVHLVIKEHEGKKHLNNLGGDKLANDNRGKGAGLPYWLILDKKGNVLADANAKTDKPSNLGCPAADDEVVIFIEKLKKTSKLSDKELETIATRFKKNNPSN
jgi:thioredoxin-related protein